MSILMEGNPLFDYQMMLRAIKLGEKGRVNAPPNPWVGCVIVKDNTVIAEGFHAFAGAPHAEIAALTQVENVEGATAYVTLEPCAHYGRTPPCVETLIQTKLARVVIGTLDPDPRVSGKGIKILKDHGIDVAVGVAEMEVKKSLAPYLYQRTHNKPYVVLKIATSLDGCMCAQDGSSQWITGEEARIDANLLRAESQAIITGVGTVKHDNPRMSVRAPVPIPLNPPLRIVLDSRGCSDPTAHVFDPALGPSLLITTKQCPSDRLKRFRQEEIAVEIVSEIEGKISLNAIFEILSKQNIIQVLVEAGPTLTSEFLKQKLFQQLTLYMGAKIMGGKGIAFSKGVDWTSLSQALPLKLIGHRAFGDTIRVDAVIDH